MEKDESMIFRERSIDERRERFEMLLKKNPNKIPVIFERHPDSQFFEADKNVKFFTDRHIVFSKLQENVRTIWELPVEQTLFFSCGTNRIINPNKEVGNIYDQW